MSKTITLTEASLAALIQSAVQTALAAQLGQRKEAAVKAAKDGRSERSIKNEVLAVKAFKKAGYKDSEIVTPYMGKETGKQVTIMTYNRWLAEGRKVKAGEHSTKVKNLRLFHISQTEAISPEEKAEAQAKMAEAIAAYQAKKAKPSTQPTA